MMELFHDIKTKLRIFPESEILSENDFCDADDPCFSHTILPNGNITDQLYNFTFYQNNGDFIEKNIYGSQIQLEAIRHKYNNNHIMEVFDGRTDIFLRLHLNPNYNEDRHLRDYLKDKLFHTNIYQDHRLITVLYGCRVISTEIIATSQYDSNGFVSQIRDFLTLQISVDAMNHIENQFKIG